MTDNDFLKRIEEELAIASGALEGRAKNGGSELAAKLRTILEKHHAEVGEVLARMERREASD